MTWDDLAVALETDAAEIHPITGTTPVSVVLRAIDWAGVTPSAVLPPTSAVQPRPSIAAAIATVLQQERGVNSAAATEVGELLQDVYRRFGAPGNESRRT